MTAVKNLSINIITKKQIQQPQMRFPKILTQPAQLAVCRLNIIPFIWFISGCGQKRPNGGPWQYAELSQFDLVTQFTATGQRDKSEETTVLKFKTGSLSFESNSIASLLNKLGKEPPKQECIAAILDQLDGDGWELVDHSISSTHTAGAVAEGVGLASHDFRSFTAIWILRRAK
jgi:hypothetical protein